MGFRRAITDELYYELRVQPYTDVYAVSAGKEAENDEEPELETEHDIPKGLLIVS